MMTASIINTDFARTHVTQTVLTVLGLSGVVLVVWPFFDGDALVGELLESWDDALWLALLYPYAGLPFFIFAGYLRWLLTGHLSRVERGFGYALALVVIVLLSRLIKEVGWGTGWGDERWVLAFLALGLGAGTWFVIQNLRRGTRSALTALVAMQLAYLPFALFYLVMMMLNMEPSSSMISGIAFLAVLVYTAQAALSVRGQSRLYLRLLPLGLVWVGGLAAGFWFIAFFSDH